MNEKINLLDDRLNHILLESRVEKNKVLQKYLEYEKSFQEFEIRQSRRIIILKQIREAKIKEIDNELLESENELKRLYQSFQAGLEAACQKYGHNFVLIKAIPYDTEIKPLYNPTLSVHDNVPGSYRLCTSYQEVKKCTVCGKEEHTIKDGLRSETHIYQQTIPDAIYDDVTLKESGITLRSIEAECHKLENYIVYLGSIKCRLMHLFEPITEDPTEEYVLAGKNSRYNRPSMYLPSFDEYEKEKDSKKI